MSHKPPGEQRWFSSEHVKLVLYGALVTGFMAVDHCERDGPPWPQPMSNNPLVTQDQLAQDLRADRDERNNSYVPGLGYYHSLYHTWYPYPYNYFYPGFGYYRGGEWHEDDWNGPVPATSKPQWDTVTQVPAGPAGYSHFYARGFTSFGASSEEGISRGVFTSPHSQSSGFHFGGFHFSG